MEETSWSRRISLECVQVSCREGKFVVFTLEGAMVARTVPQVV